MKHYALALVLTIPFLLNACNDNKFKGDANSRTAPHAKTPEVIPVPTTPTAMTPTTLDGTTGSIDSVPAKPKPPITKTEELSEKFIQQGKSGSADILLVIDDSGSMKEEQENFSTKLKDLLVSLNDADWQIGIITTSTDKQTINGKAVETGNCNMRQMLKATDPMFEDVFAKAVTASGVEGDKNEQGILQAVNGLKCKDKPWVRKDSTVAVLILSDEDNCSINGSDCPNAPSKSENFLIDYVEKDLGRTVGVNAGFYGIFSSPLNHCKTAQSDGTIYQRLFEYKASDASNYGDICADSYKSTLQSISKNIAKLLDSKFQLKRQPDADSVKVIGKKADGSEIKSDDYTMMGQSVVFKKGSEPALGSEVEVKYNVTTTLAP